MPHTSSSSKKRKRPEEAIYNEFKKPKLHNPVTPARKETAFAIPQESQHNISTPRTVSTCKRRKVRKEKQKKRKQKTKVASVADAPVDGTINELPPDKAAAKAAKRALRPEKREQEKGTHNADTEEENKEPTAKKSMSVIAAIIEDQDRADASAPSRVTKDDVERVPPSLTGTNNTFTTAAEHISSARNTPKSPGSTKLDPELFNAEVGSTLQSTPGKFEAAAVPAVTFPSGPAELTPQPGESSSKQEREATATDESRTVQPAHTARHESPTHVRRIQLRTSLASGGINVPQVIFPPRADESSDNDSISSDSEDEDFVKPAGRQPETRVEVASSQPQNHVATTVHSKDVECLATSNAATDIAPEPVAAIERNYTTYTCPGSDNGEGIVNFASFNSSMSRLANDATKPTLEIADPAHLLPSDDFASGQSEHRAADQKATKTDTGHELTPDTAANLPSGENAPASSGCSTRSSHHSQTAHSTTTTRKMRGPGTVISLDRLRRASSPQVIVRPMLESAISEYVPYDDLPLTKKPSKRRSSDDNSSSPGHWDVLQEAAEAEEAGKGTGPNGRRAKVKLKTTGKRSSHFPSPVKTQRVPAGTSRIPFPRPSAKSFGLVQEELASDPFRLLVAVTFLNKTAGKSAIPVYRTLMEQYPTPQALAAADQAEVAATIHRLGLQNSRTKSLISLARQWVENPPVKGRRHRTLHYPSQGDGKDIKRGCVSEDAEDCAGALEIGHLHGTGPYAWDSWRIFCRDRLRGVADGYNGEGRDEDFEPEWKRVVPQDKELKACLRWMWLREGWAWDPDTGRKDLASTEMMKDFGDGKAGWEQPEKSPERLKLATMAIEGPQGPQSLEPGATAVDPHAEVVPRFSDVREIDESEQEDVKPKVTRPKMRKAKTAYLSSSFSSDTSDATDIDEERVRESPVREASAEL
ncbi:hypothetical protein H2203_003956 [Taxawa tesnikishii (nom. ined.)]|nr:hypothetical protein H2203_003956 [Dothideales sp. JES 119]